MERGERVTSRIITLFLWGEEREEGRGRKRGEGSRREKDEGAQKGEVKEEEGRRRWSIKDSLIYTT